jgi:hypothetical protein
VAVARGTLLPAASTGTLAYLARDTDARAARRGEGAGPHLPSVERIVADVAEQVTC